MASDNPKGPLKTTSRVLARASDLQAATNYLNNLRGMNGAVVKHSDSGPAIALTQFAENNKENYPWKIYTKWEGTQLKWTVCSCNPGSFASYPTDALAGNIRSSTGLDHAIPASDWKNAPVTDDVFVIYANFQIGDFDEIKFEALTVVSQAFSSTLNILSDDSWDLWQNTIPSTNQVGQMLKIPIGWVNVAEKEVNGQTYTQVTVNQEQVGTIDLTGNQSMRLHPFQVLTRYKTNNGTDRIYQYKVCSGGVILPNGIRTTISEKDWANRPAGTKILALVMSLQNGGVLTSGIEEKDDAAFSSTDLAPYKNPSKLAWRLAKLEAGSGTTPWTVTQYIKSDINLMCSIIPAWYPNYNFNGTDQTLVHRKDAENLEWFPSGTSNKTRAVGISSSNVITAYDYEDCTGGTVTG